MTKKTATKNKSKDENQAFDLSKFVNQNNWPKELEDAREFARDAVMNWKWKEKSPMFLAQIDNAKTVKRLQEIVIFPLLSGEGMKVIK